MRKIVAFLIIMFPAVKFHLQAQGTLQFNRVMVLDGSQAPYTVPAGKVWKLENRSTAQSRFVSGLGTPFTTTWSGSNPNPCDGSISGSFTVQRVTFSSCQSYNTQILVNGANTAFSSSTPIWLAAGNTLQIFQGVCTHGINLNIPASTPYYDNSAGFFYCGPLSVTAGQQVTNSTLISVIEFNVIP